MTTKTSLKLKPLPMVKPLQAHGPLGAPTGNVERWLVTHRQTGGVLSVVHDYSWFEARARAEWVHKMPRDDLALRSMPYLLSEQGGKLPMNGLQLASALGLQMHAEDGASHVEPRLCGMCFSYNDDPDRLLTCVLPSHHTGEHRPFTGLHCQEIGCRREAGHRGEHRGHKKRWKTSNGKKR